MRFINLIISIFIITFISFNNVYALSCSNSEVKDLNATASYVKASYEVFDKSTKKEFVYNDNSKIYSFPNYSFEITLYNITEDIYVNVKDDITKKEISVNYSNIRDGKYVITNDDFGRIYKYTFEIMSAKSDCYGQKVKTITLVKPKYNAYSEYTYCENSSIYYCQKFVEKDLNIKDDSDFLSKIKVNNAANAPSEETQLEEETAYNLIIKNPIIYLTIFGSVIVITVLAIVFIRIRNKKKGWRL